MSRDSGNRGPDDATGAYRVSEQELERARLEALGATPPAGEPPVGGPPSGDPPSGEPPGGGEGPTVLKGRYELRRQLGRGGMGEVYEGWDRDAGLRVAIKFISEEMARDASGRMRFESEIEATKKLNHINVVRLLDQGKDARGRRFYVTELLEGRDLATVLSDCGPLPVEQVLHYADQLLAGISAAHVAGTIHRDIKPSNVMLVVQSTGDERVVVVDFGIAKMLDGPAQTEARYVMGTKRYTAPEVAHGRAATAQSDVYGVGVVLFELLTAQNPFAAAESVSMVHEKQLAADAELRVRDLNPTVPVWMDGVVAKAMAYNPEQRFASAEALRQALRQGARGSGSMRPVTGGEAVRVDQLAAGTVVDGFEIERQLGSGGMGVVYAAVERATGQRRALKFLWIGEPVETRSRLAERFRGEATKLNKLDHPRVVKNYVAAEWRGNLYLAMEFVPGVKLRDRWTSLGWEGLVRVVEQVAAGLEHCHTRPTPIFHRDVTPENILVDEQGDAKLIDFGISRDAESKLTGSSIFEMIGRYGYISPEQATRPEMVRASSDQWSLAAVVYEALAGHKPLEEDGDEDDHWNAYVGRLTKRSTVIPPPAPSSPELNAVVLRALAYEPAARFPSCTAFAAALAAAGAPAARPVDPSKDSTSASLSWTMKATPERGRRWLGVAAAAVLVAAGVGGVAFMKGDGEQDDGLATGSTPSRAAAAIIDAAPPPSPADAEPIVTPIDAPAATTAAMVRVSLRAVPAAATAEIEGKRVELPTILERPPGSRLKVRVRASGYASDTVELSFDQGGEREVRLKPRKAAAETPADPPVDNESLFVKPNSGK